MTQAFEIAGRPIGPDQPPYLIAELSGNHNGDLGRALALVDAAAETGADAVKLQTYTADTITLDVDRPEFRIHGGLWDGRSLHDLYREASTPWDWHAALFARARSHGLAVFSSPFDPTAVDFLETLDAPAYKIASFELVDTPLIRKTAATGKPLIMSTGIADYAEIEDACRAARAGGAGGLALLHCVSAYPARPEEMRLGTIATLAATFGVPVGLSDHTLGSAVAVAAVARGATIIEKHMTLRRADGGPDADFSLEPQEFRQLVLDCRMAHAALGPARPDRAGIGGANAQFRRSLYAVEDIAEGAPFTAQNVRSIRPGLGLAPKHLDRVLEARARRAIARGEPLDWSMVER
ncbi:pseudaminic acid synthase [Phaeovulum vinaykumarii]|uniref:N-acetylneuraminate synthase n=1 Tax=Phaeovulum vinaykumarii TaxID=407234 RepID=A0A1N7LG52_9RHOB|nr:pseudaminic acid synthase [Phaeovulum vinaykumarii]SIS72751.1 N-acetylneuraminate synthase [Phaeovulum vinaykumarii]SOC04498.1 N-acetylneuraminate synthase [Phaeovulum vinaykumarii]